MAWLTPERPQDVSDFLAATARETEPDRPDLEQVVDAASRPPIVFTGAPQPADTVRPLLEELRVDVVSISAPDLAQIVEYEPRDLVVTVGAGTRLEDLARTLSDRGQWLPAAASRPEATVGGLIASAVPTALDPTFGSMRRHLLACRVVTYDGRQLRWGRPVVKNVAGYDVQGLWCGSRGRLGVLIEASLRVWPLPARDALFDVVPSGHPTELLRQFCRQPAVESFRPDAVNWRWDGGATERAALQVRLFGSTGSVAERRSLLARWAAERGVEVRERESAPGTPLRPASSLTRAVVYVRVGRARLADTAERLLGAIGDKPARLDACPFEGTVRCEYDREADASLVAALAATSGDEEVMVDRGGPEEHMIANTRRGAAGVALEARVLDSLGGRERHWIAEYV